MCYSKTTDIILENAKLLTLFRICMYLLMDFQYLMYLSLSKCLYTRQSWVLSWVEVD